MRSYCAAALLFGLFFVETTAAYTKPPTIRIRNWEFEWTVVKSGDASFVLVKTDDALYARLTGGMMGSMRLTPEMAEKVAKHLWKSEKELKKVKAIAEKKGEEAQKRIDIDDEVQVVYSHDPKRGGRIYVSGKNAFMLTLGIRLSDAEILAEKMEQATSLAAAVEERVNPNP